MRNKIKVLTGPLEDELPNAIPGDIIKCYETYDLGGDLDTTIVAAINRAKKSVLKHRPDLADKLNYVPVLCMSNSTSSQVVWSDTREWTGPKIPVKQLEHFQ